MEISLSRASSAAAAISRVASREQPRRRSNTCSVNAPKRLAARRVGDVILGDRAWADKGTSAEALRKSQGGGNYDTPSFSTR
eukprot:scaffold291993_cov24-Tisochrysis_lutea.AAC.8